MNEKRVIRRKIEQLASEMNREANMKNIDNNDVVQVDRLVRFYDHKFVAWCRSQRKHFKLAPNEKAFLLYINLCR
jgi:hypothetical protein